MSSYDDCTLCEHHCRVDRTRRPAGLCGAGDRPRIFCELVEYAEEPELVPAYAVSLSGCNLRCVFCITGESSQEAGAGAPADSAALAARIRTAVDSGRARSVVLLGGEPTIWLPFLLELAGRLRGLSAPLVLKTNLFCSTAALDAALDAFDLLIADFKFGNDDCAARLGGFANYVDVLHRNLRHAAARKCVFVRHLVMPRHLECCAEPVSAWVRSALPGTRLSVRDHFVPAYRVADRPELARTTTAAESRRALALAGVPA
ncbi:MAG: radical SAM protein [Planctomycetes bacterium]|nr:radical SAM protein [Planctomycetota bacterium]